MSRHRSPFLETYTGIRFQPLRPGQTIRIEDIARALSNQCRFLGHVKGYYSVAQHSILVANWVAGQPDITSDEVLWALLHDASEAYLGDLITPLKMHPLIGDGYRVAERRLMRQVCAAFGLSPREPKIVKRGDAVLLATEVRDLKHGNPEHWRGLTEAPWAGMHIKPWAPDQAEQTFLRHYNLLMESR